MSGEVKKLRIQVYLAQAGIASRRACERLIEAGRVKVNGKTATIGQSVLPGDEVMFDGRLAIPQNKLRYILLNKPPGFISTMADERNRPIAASLLGSAVKERVYNVGRLDQWSSGLLLFTNDGELAKFLIHPSGQVDKEYLVTTDLPIPQGFAKEFSEGIDLEGEIHKAISVEPVDERTMKVVLVEGRNREIRRVLEHFGLRVLALRRIRLGPLVIGKLAEGSFRELTAEEVADLIAYSEANKGRGRV
ncbi:MAG: pseudouridine synthase [Spirochaetes bacterium]|nr:pseudouridine synthase [Spirochaetota bacterium]